MRIDKCADLCPDMSVDMGVDLCTSKQPVLACTAHVSDDNTPVVSGGTGLGTSELHTFDGVQQGTVHGALL